MPRAAFGLKKNRGGHLASTMADNEHATAALGDSEMLAVQYPVGPPIPAVFQSAEHGCEVAALMGTKKPWNILKQQPTGGQFAGHPQELPEEPRSCPAESGPFAGDGEVLAGEAADEEIKPLRLFDPGRQCERIGPEIKRFIPVALPLPHVSPAGSVWPVTGEDALAEGVKLALEGAGPSRSFKAKVESSNA